jgi:hypothetical protein
LLIAKIEEISKLISIFDRNARGFLFGDSDKHFEYSADAKEALDEMEMLLGLYFPSDIFVKKDRVYHKLLDQKNSISEFEDARINIKLMDSVRTDHNLYVDSLRECCQDLMKNYGHKNT